MHSNNQRHIIDLLKRSQNILILPSSPPDGDSLGSAVALYMALRKLQKEVTVICSDPVPDAYDFLPNMKIVGNKLITSNDFIITLDCNKIKVDKIKSSIEDNKVNIIISPKDGHFSETDITFNKGEVGYDLMVTVDTAELGQLRGIYENNIEMFQSIPVINIDHHISNTHFGKINYVDIMAASTTELLFPLLRDFAKEEGIDLIDEDVATLLLTGIITDTGSFQNANTTPRSFEVASDLIAYGARQQEIIQYIYKTKQLSQLKLWGRVLSKIQTDDKYHIVWSVVSQQDFRDTGSHDDETGDIIDELMTNAPGAEIILLIKEKKDGTISVSIRTTTPAIDASAIAERFGGGGHVQAAGFRMENTDLREAEYKIINTVKESLKPDLSQLSPAIQASIAPAAQTPATQITSPIAQVTHPTSEHEAPSPSSISTPQQSEPAGKSKKQKKLTGTSKDNFELKPPVIPYTNQEISQPEVELQPGVSYKFED